MLCPQLLLVCKYCERDVPASEMSEHESLCGDLEQQCEMCGEWVTRRDWEKHLNQRHGLAMQKSPNRQRRQQSAQGIINNRTRIRKPVRSAEEHIKVGIYENVYHFSPADD